MRTVARSDDRVQGVPVEKRLISLTRSILFVVLALSLIALTLLCLGSAFRDNDQAAIVSGALQFTRGQMSPLHSLFYNYDKQWGSYLLLAGMSLATPQMDPVLRGNVLQVALLLPAMLLSLYALRRSILARFWTFLPVFLCPALVLYTPFLATASLSLAFLFVAYFLMRTGRRPARLAAVITIAIAAACRGDVVLVVPAIVLSIVPRTSLLGLIRSRLVWTASIAAVAPVLFGKLIEARRGDDLAGFSFDLPSFAGFVIFGLGLGAVLLIGILLVSRLSLIASQPRWRVFYAAELLALLVPIGFYWSQLYSPRYFFLTLIALLFLATGRRSLVLLPHTPRVGSASILALTILPWIIGLSVPTLRLFRLTVDEPTGFPTADGLFPMGAYLSFAIHERSDRFLVDHNQKIWESAKTVNFRTCNGVVPFIATPMSNYLDLVMRFQNKTSLRLTDVSSSPCGGAYLDLRSIIRRDSQGVFVPRSNLTVVSTRPELGRPILWMEGDRTPSPEASTYQELASHYGGKDAEVFVEPGAVDEMEKAGMPDTRFSFNGQCDKVPGTAHLCIAGKRLSGWARPVFPGYINR